MVSELKSCKLEGSLRFRHMDCSYHHLIYCLASFLRWLDTFGSRVELLRSFSYPVGCGTFQLGGLAFVRPRSTCIQSSLYIQPLEAYCSLLLEHFVAALLSIFLVICGAFQIGIFIVAGFSISWIKAILRCFGLSIILRMVEVCSIVISSCLLLQHIYNTLVNLKAEIKRPFCK